MICLLVYYLVATLISQASGLPTTADENTLSHVENRSPSPHANGAIPTSVDSKSLETRMFSGAAAGFPGIGNIPGVPETPFFIISQGQGRPDTLTALWYQGFKTQLLGDCNVRPVPDPSIIMTAKPYLYTFQNVFVNLTLGENVSRGAVQMLLTWAIGTADRNAYMEQRGRQDIDMSFPGQQWFGEPQYALEAWPNSEQVTGPAGMYLTISERRLERESPAPQRGRAAAKFMNGLRNAAGVVVRIPSQIARTNPCMKIPATQPD